jgi:hypothetical protein
MFVLHFFSCHILSCFAFYLRNHLFYPHIFLLLSWDTFADIFWGWQLKHVGRLLFCLGISKPLSLRTGLVLPYMLGLDVISFSISMSLLFFCVLVFKKKKKNWGRRCGTFFFLLIDFQILHVFLPDILVHCALIKYAYIWLRVYAWYLLMLMIDSYFPHAMKMCTIQGSPKFGGIWWVPNIVYLDPLICTS